jgi:hypothetical protein
MQRIKFGNYWIDHNGISHMESEESWPGRDDLPTQDPIGDTDERVMIVSPKLYDQALIEVKKEEWSAGYKEWQEDQKKYEESMKPHLLNPEGKLDPQVIPRTRKEIESEFGKCAIKGVYKSHYERPGDIKTNGYDIFHDYDIYDIKTKCTCGTQAVYGKVPNAAHSPSCDLRKLSI